MPDTLLGSEDNKGGKDLPCGIKVPGGGERVDSKIRRPKVLTLTLTF